MVVGTRIKVGKYLGLLGCGVCVRKIPRLQIPHCPCRGRTAFGVDFCGPHLWKTSSMRNLSWLPFVISGPVTFSLLLGRKAKMGHSTPLLLWLPALSVGIVFCQVALGVCGVVFLYKIVSCSAHLAHNSVVPCKIGPGFFAFVADLATDGRQLLCSVKKSTASSASCRTACE
ncbi:hypothetical protein B0H19DRAFT_97491 [Mycena capillaripes]|nr:hypothetical protein B0H19DRAFT_97491 [Mycena capillaripes]